MGELNRGACQERSDGSNARKNPPFTPSGFCVEIVRVVTASYLMACDEALQKLENALDIPSLMGGFSIQNQFIIYMALTRSAESFFQSSRMTSITFISNSSNQPRDLLVNAQYPLYRFRHRTVRQNHECNPLASRIRPRR